MDQQELKDKLRAILDEADEDLDVFVSIVNIETNKGECLGHGCAGCHTNVISQLHQQGFYRHTHEVLHPEDDGKVH